MSRGRPSQTIAMIIGNTIVQDVTSPERKERGEGWEEERKGEREWWREGWEKKRHVCLWSRSKTSGNRLSGYQGHVRTRPQKIQHLKMIDHVARKRRIVAVRRTEQTRNGDDGFYEGRLKSFFPWFKNFSLVVSTHFIQYPDNSCTWFLNW